MRENSLHPLNRSDTLLQATYRRARACGMSHLIAEDITRKPVSYRGLFVKTIALSEGLKKNLTDEPNVGVLLPTASGALMTILALQRLKKIPAMLNFSAGAHNLKLACETAELQTVLTSRAFIQKAKLEDVIEKLISVVNVIYLEDLRKHITASMKLKAALCGYIPPLLRAQLPVGEENQPALILFTSGSEGTPKGVALTHYNILYNIYQVTAALSFSKNDIMFNALPIFHSFGLTVGTLLPLLLGFKTFLYPSPLHYRIIPGLVGESGASIMLGTDTFYRGYAAYAKPEDFSSLRLAVAGAEKLRNTTYDLYLDKFGLNILQGYGVTEASPVVSCNTPEQSKLGTVGKLFQGIEARLEPVEGLDSGARLLIRGDNIMLGYMRHAKPGIIEKQGQWYDTGDIVDIDPEGYMTILGRAKRFAKIGGEMISLGAVEEFANLQWPDAQHAAIAVNDERKGEQIWLYTTQPGLERSALVEQGRAFGLPELAIPKKVMTLPELPLLGSGKPDYMKLKEISVVDAE